MGLAMINMYTKLELSSLSRFQRYLRWTKTLKMGLTVEALYERILVKILAFERGVGHFERKFQGKGVVHQ